MSHLDIENPRATIHATMYALRLLLILAMLGAATASNENSDVCATASAYDGTLSGPSGECDTMIPYVATTMYASDISSGVLDRYDRWWIYRGPVYGSRLLRVLHGRHLSV